MMLVSLLICASLGISGCQKETKNNAQGIYEEEKTSNAQDIGGEEGNLKNYDIYSSSPPQTSDFNKRYTNYAVDIEYENALSQCQTTQEFILNEQRFIDVWKNEINSHLAVLTTLLSEEDKVDLLVQQEEWENAVLHSLNVDRKVLGGDQACAIYGSSFEWKWLSAMRNEYRNRAIHLDYLVYLRDTV